MATNPSVTGPDPQPAPIIVPISGPAELSLRSGRDIPYERPMMERALQAYAEQAGRLLGLIVRYSEQFSNRAKDYSKKAYRQSAEEAKDLSAKTQTQIAWVRREHPMEGIGVMCGIGIVTGIALRIWRSQNS